MIVESLEEVLDAFGGDTFAAINNRATRPSTFSTRWDMGCVQRKRLIDIACLHRFPVGLNIRRRVDVVADVLIRIHTHRCLQVDGRIEVRGLIARRISRNHGCVGVRHDRRVTSIRICLRDSADRCLQLFLLRLLILENIRSRIFVVDSNRLLCSRAVTGRLINIGIIRRWIGFRGGVLFCHGVFR